jgi:hypothetical protein
MKQVFKIVSTASIILFGISWLMSKFNMLEEYNSMDLRNLLVVIYLFASLRYFQMELKEKNAVIQDLEIQLKKAGN